MCNEKIIVRAAVPKDAEALLELYRPYVEQTAITFEYEVPTLEEFRRRIADTLQMYPYIVASVEDKMVGYAYASAFKERSAYDWAVETSIYVDADAQGIGVGKKLYAVLEELLKKQNILNLNACIAYTDEEDERLTNHSMYFHEHLGYRLVGRFTQCGYKFGKWYDMIWMEKMIGDHVEKPEPVIPFTCIDSGFVM